MRYLTILAIPSILAAANHLAPRQEADPLLTLRANFCIDYHRPECEDSIIKCQRESKVIEDCIRDEHPTCIKPETSSCSQAIVQCMSDFGGEEDAVEAVQDCIIEKVVSAGNDEEEEPPTKTKNKEAASPEQVAACKKASAEYQVAMLENDCDVETEGENSVERRAESAACETAGKAFEKAWSANKCETEFGA